MLRGAICFSSSSLYSPYTHRDAPNLPAEDRAILEKRLEEIRQLAERGTGFVQNGYTRDWTNGILDHSYLMSKDGLREAMRFKIDDANGPNGVDYGWFRSGGNNNLSPSAKKNGELQEGGSQNRLNRIGLRTLALNCCEIENCFV